IKPIAADLAAAMGIPSGSVVSASLNESAREGVAVWSSPVGSPQFPNQGNSFAILSTGPAAAVDGSFGDDLSFALGGQTTTQGADLVQLDLVLQAPSSANCFQFDFAFFTEEHPGFAVIDRFLAEVGGSVFTINPGSIVKSPNSIVGISRFPPIHKDTGTPYNGATGLLSAKGQVTPGSQVQVTFSIMDLVDSALDSAVFLDNFRWMTVAPGQCQRGAEIVGLGDVDCNGSVTSIDAALILQLIADIIASLECPDNADTNIDGEVNSVDVALLLQRVAGIIPKLPPFPQ
ncbi:MAG: dockerin type I repeat-containing protein, partial [Dehalococcoidia bacterium]|nr:dockerin type I repeat-containing protein [Dehalococcoidia bacterium]